MSRSLPSNSTLDQNGVPHRWVTWQQAVWYYAKAQARLEARPVVKPFTVWGGPQPPHRRALLHHRPIRSSRSAARRSPSRASTPRPAAQQPRALQSRLLPLVLPRRGVSLAVQAHLRPHPCPCPGAARLPRRTWSPPAAPATRGRATARPEEAHMQLLYAPYVPNRAEFLRPANRPHPRRPDGVPSPARVGEFAIACCWSIPGPPPFDSGTFSTDLRSPAVLAPSSTPRIAPPPTASRSPVRFDFTTCMARATGAAGRRRAPRAALLLEVVADGGEASQRHALAVQGRLDDLVVPPPAEGLHGTPVPVPPCHAPRTSPPR